MRGLVLGSLILGLATACSGGDTVVSTNPEEVATSGTALTSPEWGDEALAWREALVAAGREGIWNQARFWDEDIVVEDRPITGRVLHGREAYIDYWIDRFDAALPSTEPGSLFLSADETLNEYRLAVDDPQLKQFETPIDFLDRMRIGHGGVELIVGAGSVQDGYRYLPERKESIDETVTLANRYVEFWNGRNANAARDMYLPDATVEDTLLGVSIQGSKTADTLGSEEWPTLPPMEIVTLPDDGGPAVYGGYAVPDPLRESRTIAEVHLILEVDDGTGCPGLMGVALGWDQEQVVWERRYHEVTSVRDCIDTDRLEPGWWEAMRIPDPVRMDHTGTMSWPEHGLSVEIYNGVPGVDDFVRWGLNRYAVAGLSLPSVGSVTFLIDKTTCRQYIGFATGGPNADIILCNRADQVCEDATCDTWKPSYKAALLHEYGHVWISDNLDETTRTAFLDLIGVTNWTDPNIPHTQQGVEYAANTLVYGLLDDDTPALIATDWDCQQREEAFRLITDTAPISTCQP